MRAADLAPVPESEQTARPFDLFLIFAGANVVATTLQAGASLPAALGPWGATAAIGGGALVGAGLVALLAPIGSRLRVPSIVAARAVLGYSGARMLALILFVTNFAWIALNNAIAASITAAYAGVGDPRAWAVGLGLLATLVVRGGPRAAALVDRVAVPLLALSGAVFTWACLRASWPAWPDAAVGPRDLARALDVVVGYQSSWLLMFADYPRYVRAPRAAGWAVFWGLGLTAAWFMPLGFVASAIAGSADPGAMVGALGIGGWGALLISVATLTTNFVNIYMSALALKSLRPETGDTAAIWLIGGVGAALGLLSTSLIERFAGFTLVLASLLVPIGGMLLAHFSLLGRPPAVDALYVEPVNRWAAWSPPGTTAWAVGLVVFHLAQPVGGTIPCLVTTILVYGLLSRRGTPQAGRGIVA